MAVAKVECPECGKVLKPTKPLTPGKKVRCPKCDAVFTVPGAAEDEAPVVKEAIRKAGAPAPKKAAPAKPKTAPPPEPKKPSLDEDDDGGSYGIVKEPGEVSEEEEEKKPKINYVPDLEVKDPRGPATLALALPSNVLMLIGALQFFGYLVGVAVATWPFMFTEQGTSVTPLEARKEFERTHRKKVEGNQPQAAKKDEAEPEVKFEDLTTKPDGGELAVFEELKEEDTWRRIIWAIGCVVGAALGGVTAFAAVKMQNLESYRWAWAAAILGLQTLLAVPFAIMAITQLKRDEVKAAFEYVPE